MGGKSTTIQLIERFYDVSTGKITIDGVEVKDYNLHWLRNQIGLVAQEPILFNTTIIENIRWGKANATVEEVEAAAKMANAHDFIMKFDDKYDTNVGEKGAQLSGGQKQRIAIARAVLKDPKILLLDEATSALDSESEHIVQEALDRLMKDRTTLVIAHRLSTIRDSDIIYVVDKGSVIESGNHDELMAKNGPYANLVKRQLKYEAKEKKAKEIEESERTEKEMTDKADSSSSSEEEEIRVKEAARSSDEENESKAVPAPVVAAESSESSSSSDETGHSDHTTD